MPVPPFPDAPPGQPQLIQTRNFGGVNQTLTLQGIGDEEFFWLENLMPIGNGNLRATWGPGPILFTSTGPRIINVFFFNISTKPLSILFFDDGSAIQVSPITGAQMPVASAGTFYSGGYLPQAAQWSASGIVIVSEATNPSGFWAWDGTFLVGPGGVAPQWLTGGIANFMMPFGIHGNAIEVYQNRVWITTPPQGGVLANIIVSAPENGADFNPSDGSNITPQSDSSLRYVYQVMKQSNGFLYLIGDSNLSVISNVQTSGSPVVTTYFLQNIDPQIGTPWPRTAQLFGNALIYANTSGIYALSGGVVQKISQNLDNAFFTANFVDGPTAAVGMIFNQRCYMFTVIIPATYGGRGSMNPATRRVTMCWNGQKWFFISGSGGNDHRFVYGQEFNGVQSAFASDGLSLWQLFQIPNKNLSRIMQGKLHSGAIKGNDDGWITYKKLYRIYVKADDYAGTGVSIDANSFIHTDQADSAFSPNAVPISLTLTAMFFEFVNNSVQILHFQNNSSQTILWGVAGNLIVGNDISTYGRFFGYEMLPVGADFSIVATAMVFSYDQTYLG